MKQTTTTPALFTRKQYLNNECTHEQYYNQFVTSSTLAIVKSTFGEKELRKAFEEDQHFNTIPLRRWDALAPFINSGGKMKEAGDSLTLSGIVCIAKAAAKIIISEKQPA